MDKFNKPDFLVVGAAKSGTTSLFNYLNQHPDIYIPEVKECRFFSQLPKNFKGLGAEFFPNSGITDEKEYFNLFEGQKDKVCGDISNDYLYYYEESIKNIKKYLGNEVKIIIILRNPINRAYSNYLHALRDSWEDCSFEEALIKETWRIKNNWAWPYHYVNAGMYYDQVKAYIEDFKNIKIFLFEDLQNKEKFFNELFNFLEIEKITIEDKKVYNMSGIPKNKLIANFVNNDNFVKKVGKFIVPKKIRKDVLNHIKNKNLKREPMRMETKEFLKEVFKDNINKLSKLIDRDLSKWLKV